MLRFLLLLALCLNSLSVYARDYIVKVKAGRALSLGFATSSVPLISQLNMELVSLPDVYKNSTAKQLLIETGLLDYVQEDHVLSRRVNDDLYSDQWSLHSSANHLNADISAAWDELGGGGEDARSQMPVLGIVDFGFDLNHSDLIENLWKNNHEVPGNNIDDDNNGFVDDFDGWNASSQTGVITSGSHGTHVAGIIGAKGNNSIGISGVNWNTKVALVQLKTAKTSEVLIAYNYFLKQKQLFLETQGRLGANIVAINSSFGRDGADCQSGDFPAWNDIFNELGQVGVLSIGATANSGVDIDVVGDVPTNCTSDFLISVTNINKQGHYKHSGLGLTSIDLAAPGRRIVSTLPGNSYGAKTGTSMSTPHVTGAIGYLHSVASQKFNDEYYADPAKAAINLKGMILQSVKKHESLEGKTVSGGYLDVYQAARAVSSY